MANQTNFPAIYIDNGDGGVGSEADPYNSLSDINWTTGGDNSVFDYYDGVYGAPTESLTINLKKGEMWRGGLATDCDGTATYPIIIQAHGDGNRPIVNGAQLITPGSSWSTSGGNVWEATLTTQPQQVFMDGNFGDRKTDVGNLADEYDWRWTGNVLYIWSEEDPDTAYTSPGVESGYQWRIISIPSDYIIVDGLHVLYANRAGIGVQNPGSHVIVKNCLAEWNFTAGIFNETLSDNTYEDWIIEDNETRYNSTGGIGLNGIASNCIIRRNTSHQNGKYRSEYNTRSFAWGIKCFQEAGLQEGHDIYENLVYDNGEPDLENPQAGWGVGIWYDACSNASDNRGHIHHNCVNNNQGHGIFLELSSYTDVDNNLIFDNGRGGGQNGPSGVCIDARQTGIVSFSDYNCVYNNSIYGGLNGIRLFTYAQGVDTSISYNEVRNNIAVGQSVRALNCDAGGNNVGSYGTGNVYDNNCFGVEFEGFIQWGNWITGLFDTYEDWMDEAGTDPAWEQLDEATGGSDPSFNNVGADEYWLAPGSPCIDAGENLGPPYNIALLSSSVHPSSVVTGNQDDY
jgi:hypothetical protein